MSQPRGNGQTDGQPKGHMTEIPKVTDQQIWAAGGSVNMVTGHITGTPRTT